MKPSVPSAEVKKKVFIVHPLTSYGEPILNFQRVGKICRSLLESRKDIVPVSPIHAFSFVDWDGPQETVMEWCLHLLKCCDELWVYGKWWLSAGCVEVVSWAAENKIPIIYKEE